MKRLALDGRVLLHHIGWATPVALLCLAIAIFFLAGLVLYERQGLQRKRLELHQFKAMLAKRIKSAADEEPMDVRRLQQFQQVLAQETDLPRHLATIFAIASAEGIVLQHAEYRWDVQKHRQYRVYRIFMPVKAPYAATRRFCDRLLNELPFLALEQVHFKREAIGAQAVESKLQVALYLRADSRGNSADSSAMVAAMAGE